MKHNETNCPPNEIFADYVEGELSDSEREACELHCQNCLRCQELLAGWNSLKKGMVIPNLEGSAEFISGVMQSVRRKGCDVSISKRFVREWSLQIFGLALGVALLCLRPPDNKQPGTSVYQMYSSRDYLSLSFDDILDKEFEP